VTLCSVAKRYILQQKCLTLNKWIGDWVHSGTGGWWADRVWWDWWPKMLGTGSVTHV